MLVKRFFACLLALALLVGMLSGCAAKPSECSGARSLANRARSVSNITPA